MKLCNYRMTHDTGFAPNYKHGFLTLATCKPVLRRTMQVGEWIAGWYSKTLDNEHPNNYQQGVCEKLIYLAKISKVVPYKDYWNGKEYQDKKNTEKDPSGDNIYFMADDGKIYQDSNKADKDIHIEPDVQQCDIRGENALICNEFYYFGHEKALEVPPDVRPPLTNRGHRVEECEENIKKFVNFVINNKDQGTEWRPK